MSEKELGPISTTLLGLTEALTAIASSDRKEWALSIGYFLQRLRGHTFLQALNDEYESLRKKGRIKDDYPETEQCRRVFRKFWMPWTKTRQTRSASS